MRQATIRKYVSEHRVDKQRGFEQLVVEHHVRVRAFIRSLGVDSDWVDDLAQEAFMVAFRDWDSFDQERDFGKWVRGIAANLVRNEIRKNARRQRILHTGLADLLVRRQQAALEDAAEPLALRLDIIRACLAKLSPAHRQIVQGRYRDGLSAPELGDRLGMSAASIRQTLTRVRRQLRLCVEFGQRGKRRT